MKLIGIDPGSEGAIVELDLTEKIAKWMKLPWREDDLLDEFKIREHFDFNEAHYIYIEKVSPNKLFGCSNFTFGMNFMAVLSMIGQRYPYSLVSPKNWQKRFNSAPKPNETAKQRTKAAFRKMNPNFGIIEKSEHEGLIDAFFIAYYAGLSNNVVMPMEFNFVQVDS